MRAFNSTIRLKQKRCIRCGKPCLWFSNKRCQECARIEDAVAADSEENIRAEDLSGLIEDADTLISRYVRMSAADKNGNVKCFTCDSTLPWRHCDAGHFIPRSCIYLRHDLRNIRPQCHVCNRAKYGRAAIFSQNLERESPGLPDILLEESRIVYHITREELRQLISELTQKILKL